MLGTTAQQHDMTDTKYKNTELGPIPEHWELRQWQYLLQENVTTNTDCKETHQLQFKYGDIVSKANQEVDADTLKIISKYTKVQPNDIMINGLNLNYDFISQRIGMVRTNGIITSAYISLRPTEEANPSYYNYLLKAMDAQKMFHGMGTGVRLTLSYKELKNKYLPFPPLDEQEAMVAYLDEQTGKIDAAIEREQKMIDLLNERKQIIIQNAVTKGLRGDTSEWKVYRLGMLGTFSKGGNISRDDLLEDGEKEAILYGDIYTKYFVKVKAGKNHISSQTAKGSIRIQNGDILMTGSGETKEDIGKTVIYKGSEAYIGGDVILFRQTENNGDFLSYSLNSQLAKDYRYRYSKGEIIVHIYPYALKNLYISIPPTLEEQREIVSYLDAKIESIDKAIESREKLISLLRERKQIIVNEVVTGKIKVS